MEIISATAFTSPIKTKTIAITLVKMVAFLGSLFFLVPLETQKLTRLFGKTLSPPMACNVLGATINDPKADEIVAAAKPNWNNWSP